MKLIYCPCCLDIVLLRVQKNRTCECGKSSGYYIDDVMATIAGEAIPIGFANRSFAEALELRPPYGMGETFKAFVIPVECPSIFTAKKP